MCVVSLVTDHFYDKWKMLPQPVYPQPYVYPTPPPVYPTPPPPISAEEIDDFRRLLERAREYDRRNSEPDCELAEKRERLLQLARDLGVEIAFLDSPQPAVPVKKPCDSYSGTFNCSCGGDCQTW